MLVDKPSMGRQINWAHPLSRGLVGCWLFNEGSGNKVNDLSLFGNHGTLAAGAAMPTWVPGRTGPALDFDGIDDHVDCGNEVSLDNPYPITIEFWINSSDTTQSYKRIFASPSTFTSAFSVVTISDGKLQFGYGDNVIATTKKTSFSLTANSWQHIILIIKSTMSEAECYLNGVAGTVSSGSGASLYTGNVLIGARTGGSYFNGAIDGVRIYNRALSASEIWQLYTESYSMFAPSNVEAMLYTPPVGGLSIPVAMHHYEALRV